jgi:hypothetical protein
MSQLLTTSSRTEQLWQTVPAERLQQQIIIEDAKRANSPQRFDDRYKSFFFKYLGPVPN